MEELAGIWFALCVFAGLRKVFCILLVCEWVGLVLFTSEWILNSLRYAFVDVSERGFVSTKWIDGPPNGKGPLVHSA